mgnify:CR=1 FL=1
MRLQLKRRKQCLSFLPVKVSLNNSKSRILTVNEEISRETREKKINLKYGLFGLKHETVINLNSSEIEIEVFFNFHNIYKNLIIGFVVLLGLGFLSMILDGIIVLIIIFPILMMYNLLNDSLLILIKE